MIGFEKRAAARHGESLGFRLSVKSLRLSIRSPAARRSRLTCGRKRIHAGR